MLGPRKLRKLVTSSKDVCDLSGLGLTDALLPPLLAAAAANASLHTLILAGNPGLTCCGDGDGGDALLALLGFIEGCRQAFVVDLSGCGLAGAAMAPRDAADAAGACADATVEGALLAVFGSPEGESATPAGRGVRVLAASNAPGLSPAVVAGLANAGPGAEAAAARRAACAARTAELEAAFNDSQAALAEIWAHECDECDGGDGGGAVDESIGSCGGGDGGGEIARSLPPPPPTAADVVGRMQALQAAGSGGVGVDILPPCLAVICPPLQNDGSGGDGDDDGEGYERRTKMGRSVRKRSKQKQKVGESDEAYAARLAEAAAAYESYLARRKVARAVLRRAGEEWCAGKLPGCEAPALRRGSGMLLAHLSYIAGAEVRAA